MSKTLYRVTDAAPSRVCGLDVRTGDLLCLPEQVAEYERDLGHLATTSEEAGAARAAPAADAAVPDPVEPAAADEA